MIPRDFITEWRGHAPWKLDAQVEQDLVISRALVEIFRVPELADRLSFRGGTALYKLHLLPPARYSEDIDLVQVTPEPIGPTMMGIRAILDPWLGTPAWQTKEAGVNLTYRFASEDTPPLKMRLKIEINTREHFAELGLLRHQLEVANRWFSGGTDITTFALPELLGTKLRALYQRKKGRDLFDLWFALRHADVEVAALLRCFHRYMADGGHAATRAQFEANLQTKARDPDFRDDIAPLLRPGIAWDFDEAVSVVSDDIIAALPGEPWKGDRA
jgi:predicted nucleotidyltransferase component of viral defense system